MAATRTRPGADGPGEDPDVFVTDLLRPGGKPHRHPVRWVKRRAGEWLLREDGTPTVVPRPPVPLRTGQLAAVVVACGQDEETGVRDEALVRLMAETGMHTHEVLDLRVGDVGLTQLCVVVGARARQKERLVPIGPQTARALRTHLARRHDEDPWLWPGGHGGPLSSYELHTALARYAPAAGVHRLDPDALRLTAATRWLAAGGTPGAFVTIAGWRRGDPVDRHTQPESVLNALDQAPKLGLDDY